MNKEKQVEGKVFKLSNGEKISSVDLEEMIFKSCHYINYVVVDQEEPPISIFPDHELIQNPDYHMTPEQGCFCPRSLEELSRCLRGCLKGIIKQLEAGSAKINSAAIITTNKLSGSGENIKLLINL